MPDDTIRIRDRITWYEMSPIREDPAGNEIPPTTGLVFVPGARVDPRAYANVLRPLVDAGFFVAVLKDPLRLLHPRSGPSQDRPRPASDIDHWAVGGHSLGGTTAAVVADTNEQVNGLVLFASVPGRPDRAHRPEGVSRVRYVPTV